VLILGHNSQYLEQNRGKNGLILTFENKSFYTVTILSHSEEHLEQLKHIQCIVSLGPVLV